MKLVKDWREAYKWFSTWSFVAIMAVSAGWSLLPPDMQQAVSGGRGFGGLSWAVFAIATVGSIGRVVDQTKKEEE